MVNNSIVFNSVLCTFNFDFCFLNNSHIIVLYKNNYFAHFQYSVPFHYTYVYTHTLCTIQPMQGHRLEGRTVPPSCVQEVLLALHSAEAAPSLSTRRLQNSSRQLPCEDTQTCAVHTYSVPQRPTCYAQMLAGLLKVQRSW